jgi:hypothetical protein
VVSFGFGPHHARAEEAFGWEWESSYRRVLHGWNFPEETLAAGPYRLGIGECPERLNQDEQALTYTICPPFVEMSSAGPP